MSPTADGYTTTAEIIRALEWLLAEARWWAENDNPGTSGRVVPLRLAAGQSSVSNWFPWSAHPGIGEGT